MHNKKKKNKTGNEIKWKEKKKHCSFTKSSFLKKMLPLFFKVNGSLIFQGYLLFNFVSVVHFLQEPPETKSFVLNVQWNPGLTIFGITIFLV